MADEIEARVDAYRAAVAAIAMVLDDVAPGAFESVIDALETFEAGMRQQNYEASTISELFAIRTRMEKMRRHLPEDPNPRLKRRSPPTDTEG